MIVIDQDRYPFGPDRSDVLQAALNKLRERGFGRLHIEGRHRFDKLSVLEVPDTPFENGVAITGDGEFVTALIAGPDNRDGILRINRADNQATMIVEKMALLSVLHKNDTGKHNGTALTFTAAQKAGERGYGDHRVHSVIARDLFIGPDGANPGDTANRGRWVHGLNIENQWYPSVRHVRIQTNNDEVSSHGLKFLDCYDARAHKVYVHGRWKRGIGYNSAIGGETYEGGIVSECTIVNPDVAVWVDHTFDKDWLYEPGFHLLNCHINPYNHGAIFTRHRHILVQGNQFYAPNGSWDRTAPQTVGLWFAPGAEASVTGNQFLEPGYYHDDANCNVSIRLEEECQGILIAGNIFNTGGIGILNRSRHAGKNVVGLNTYSDGQRDGQWAPFKAHVDEAKTLRMAA